MLKQFVQPGRSDEEPKRTSGYVEGLNDARTTLGDCFSILRVILRRVVE